MRAGQRFRVQGLRFEVESSLTRTRVIVWGFRVWSLGCVGLRVQGVLTESVGQLS